MSASSSASLISPPPTSSWEWKQSNEEPQPSSFIERLIASSCPQNDDIQALQKYTVERRDDERSKDRPNDEDASSEQSPSVRAFYAYLPPGVCSALKLYKNDSSASQLQMRHPPLRIILAIHCHACHPRQEVAKWKDAASELNAVIIAPEGWSSDDKLGWNAVDCCGASMEKNVDDLDFVIRGAVEVFWNDWKTGVEGGRSMNVVATGYSNGGFFTSMMGLLPSYERPSWLAGVVPTGGYQYDDHLYGSRPSGDDGETSAGTLGDGRIHITDPLPIFLHHGGKDGNVKPQGCCINDDIDPLPTEPNCPANLGAKRSTCLSVLQSIQLWALNINACSEMALTNDTSVSGKKVTCFEGSDCRAPARLCTWTNEDHSWEETMPGVDLSVNFMKGVFATAEERQQQQQQIQNPSSQEDQMANPLLVWIGMVMVVLLAVRDIRKPFTIEMKQEEDERERIVPGPNESELVGLVPSTTSSFSENAGLAKRG